MLKLDPDWSAERNTATPARSQRQAELDLYLDGIRKALATGKPFSFNGVTFMRVENGKIPCKARLGEAHVAE